MKNRKIFRTRTVSLVLALLMAVTSFVFTPVADAAGASIVIGVNSETIADRFVNPNNLTVTYSDAQMAAELRVSGTASDPYAYMNVESFASVSASEYKYIVVTYKTPSTNSANAKSTDLYLCAGNITAPTPDSRAYYSVTNGSEFRSQTLDVTSLSNWTGTVHSIRFDPFSTAVVGDVFYFYSIAFCKDSATAQSVAAAQASAANSGIPSEALPEPEEPEEPIELDYKNLVFDNSTAMGTITATNNVTVTRSSANKSALVTVTAEDPWIRVNYPANEVSASTYKYIVMVYKIPEGTTVSNTQVFYNSGSNTGDAEARSYTFAHTKGIFSYQVINLSSATWSGTVRSIRIDPYVSAVSGDTMYLHSLAMFETASEASSYGAMEAGILNGTYLGQNAFYYFNSSSDESKVTSTGVSYEKGDINKDGRINSTDIAALKKHLSGVADMSEGCPDVDGDGRFSIKDALCLRKIIAGHMSSPGTYGSSGATVDYSATLSGMSISLSDGANPNVEIALTDKSVNFSTYKYATLIYYAPSNTATTASAYIVTANGQSEAKNFAVSSDAGYKSVTIDFTDSELTGNITKLVISLGEDFVSGESICIDSVILSDSDASAARAAAHANLAANREIGMYNLVTGQNEISLNDMDTMVTYSYYNSVSNGGMYNYTSKLIAEFDRQPENAFDRFTLGYSSTTLARGVITYNVNGASVQDEFFLEAGTNLTFTSLINGYFNGQKASEIVSIVINPISASSSGFALNSVKTEDYTNYSGTLYLENSNVKLGVLLDMGGGISYYEDKNDNNANYKNLLNSYDVGRLVQQSYYGIDKEPYELGQMMDHAWRYNPVQGGDVANNPSRVVDVVVSGTAIYVKTRPMDWGHNGHITPSYMENNYELYDTFAKVTNRFVDFSGYTHTAASQELPAFYTISALTTFSMHNGSSAWTGQAYSSYPNLVFWDSNPSQRYTLSSTSESWFSFTDTSGFGIGLYVPNVTSVLAGRFIPEVQSYDPKDASTCYFAPIRNMTLKSGKALTYSYLICAGNIANIRSTFQANRGLVNNSSLSGY